MAAVLCSRCASQSFMYIGSCFWARNFAASHEANTRVFSRLSSFASGSFLAWPILVLVVWLPAK